MVLRNLEVRGFRNLQVGRVEFGRGVNLFWGRNGAGKSNLLEAIYFLFTTRSFRARTSGEMVAEGAESFRLAGDVEGPGGCNRLEVVQGPGGRTVFLDEKKAGLEEVLSRFSVLVFSSHQMNILRGAPRDRRRFLDRGILATRPAYLRDLRDYGRALAQRNQLLRERSAATALAAWDETFVTRAARVVCARAAFARQLGEAVGRHAGDLLPPGWQVQVEYRPRTPLPDGDPDEASIAEALRAHVRRLAAAERKVAHSLLGPHRDEMVVRGDGRDLSRFGSGGQQRGALLALKLTRMELYREVRGEPPLLLLDDVDSDLDDQAADRLLERAGRYQAFLTTCRAASRARFAPRGRSFQMDDGLLSMGAS